VAGCCEHGDEPSGSAATELVGNTAWSHVRHEKSQCTHLGNMFCGIILLVV
jgi:hypothetical protein